MSANFHISKNVTKDLEGGFFNDPSAGYTYNGISYKYNPLWKGWPLLFQLAARRYGHISKTPRYAKFDSNELNVLVDAFKKTEFWDRFIGDNRLLNQDIANFIYDFIFHKKFDAVAVINATAKSINAAVQTRADKLSDAVVTVINTAQQKFYKLLYNNRKVYYKNPRAFTGTKSAPFSKSLQDAFIRDRVQKFPATTKDSRLPAFYSPFQLTL